MFPTLSYRLPEKFYIREKSIPYKSSTVGAFSAQDALQGDKAFQGRSIPGLANDNTHKKTLIINYCPDHSDFYHIIYHLLDLNFTIYFFYQGKPKLLTSFPIEDYQFDRGMDHQKASDELVKCSINPLRADHILICDYLEMRELFGIVVYHDLHPSEEEAFFDKQFSDVIKEQWLKTQTLPQGKNYPAIPLDENLCKIVGEQGLDAMQDSNIKVKLDFSQESQRHIDFSLNLPPVKVTELKIFSYSYHVKEKIIVSSLEKLSIKGQPSYFGKDDEDFIRTFSRLGSLELSYFRFNKYKPEPGLLLSLSELVFNLCHIDDISISNILNNIPEAKKLTFSNTPNQTIRENVSLETGCLDKLIELSVCSNEMDLGGSLFKVARRLKRLHLTWQEDMPLSILTEASMPELTEINVSNSVLTEAAFLAVLKLSRKFMKMTFQKTKVVKGEISLPWDEISLDEVLSLNISKSQFHSETLVNLFGKLKNIESLNMSEIVNPVEFPAETMMFGNLKYLNISSLFSVDTEDHHKKMAASIRKIILQSNKLVSLNIAKNINLYLLRLTDPTIAFPDLEVLVLSGLTISLNDLNLLRNKMPQLKVLRLDQAEVCGNHLSKIYFEDKKLNDKETSPLSMLGFKNKLISINLNKCKIDNIHALNESILKNAAIIKMNLAGLNAPLTLGGDLLGLEISGSILNNLSSLSAASKKQRIKKLLWRSPVIHGRDDISVFKNALSSVSHFEIDAGFSSGYDVYHEKMLEFISLMPELMFITGSLEILRDDVIDRIKKGQFRYKKSLIWQIVSASQARRQSLGMLPDAVLESPANDQVIGNHAKVAGYIYDDDRTNLTNMSMSLSVEDNSIRKLRPLFEHVSGIKIEIENIRKWAYRPVYNFITNTIEKEAIKPVLVKYNYEPTTPHNASIFKRTPYQAFINPKNKDIHKPWIKLEGLKVYDRLLYVSIAGLKPGDYTEYYSKPDGFFYICFNDVTLKSVNITFAITPIDKQFETYPDEIGKIFEPFKRQFEKEPAPSFASLSLREQLISICKNPEFHACGVRAKAFLFEMAKLRDKGIINDYRYGGSPLHGWAEVLYQNEWYTIDLGGAPVTIEYEPLPEKQTSLKLVSNEISTNKNDAEHEIASIDKLKASIDMRAPNGKLLLVCKNEAHLLEMRRLIRSIISANSVVIDSPKDANASSRYIALNKNEKTWGAVEPKDGEGWLKNCLSGGADSILIDWSAFSVSEAASINTCIESENRSIDGVAIDASVQVIGLITAGHILLEDSSFTGRHKQQTFTVICSATPMGKPIFDDNALSIELYHSSRWKDFILGKLVFSEGIPTHEKNILLSDDDSLPVSLVLRNPPKDCLEFVHFLQDLEEGRAFKYYNMNLCLPKLTVHVMSHELKMDSSKIASINTNVTYDELCHVPIDYVLTPSTFERCMISNDVSDEGVLISKKGWLKNKNASSFFITQDLSDEQYAYLLNESTHPVRLYFAPGVSVPAGMNGYAPCNDSVKKLPKLSDANIIVCPNGPALDMDAIVIDVSEFSSDDILYGFSYQIDEKVTFKFKKVVSEVWKALYEGKHVCLSGTFSNEIMDHLSTLMLPEGYLWLDGKKEYYKGKLTLMPKFPITSLTWRQQIQAPDSPKIPTVKQHFQAETEAERLPLMMRILETNPWVLIEGEPGVGKSCFIRELFNNPSFKCFSYNTVGNSGLESFAESDDPRINLLIIDEALLWGGERAEFNRLSAKDRLMLINQKLYHFGDNKKVIFLGNLIERMPSLFNEAFPILTFHKLTNKFVVKTILEPIYHQIGRPEAAQAYLENDKSGLNVRDLQDKAMTACARLKYSHTVLFSEAYLLTESRIPIYQNILDILLARRLRQDSLENADAVRYGGKPGCWLEGAPGAGKTELIRSTLVRLGYEQKSIAEMYEHDHAENTNCYFQVPASCDIDALRKHVAYAFNHGLILKIDELDVLLDAERSSPEQVSRFIAELNSYLMGEDLNFSRPIKPGFTLLATGNGTNMYGRAPLSEALKSRLNVHQVNPYTLKECLIILFKSNKDLEAKFVASLEIQSHVNDLILKYQKHPKKYTFRSLLKEVASFNASVKQSSGVSQNYQQKAASESTLIHSYRATKYLSHHEFLASKSTCVIS